MKRLKEGGKYWIVRQNISPRCGSWEFMSKEKGLNSRTEVNEKWKEGLEGWGREKNCKEVWKERNEKEVM